jgi:hypothetical protein
MRLCLLLGFIFKTMKTLVYMILFLKLSSVFCQNENVDIELFADVTKDAINEKIVIKELSEEGDLGKVRLLEIFKKVQKNWVVIASSKTAILSSESGGIMGDPFHKDNIRVAKGIIIITHYGGSSWKWSTTHKYRFQNNVFELIGYESSSGKPCEYWENVSYNLSNGKIIYTRENDVCEDYESEYHEKGYQKEIYVHKLKTIPTIENINITENKITSPKYKAPFYF